MKKKIAIITSGHPYYDERIFYKFARSLNKHGYEVSVVCSTAEGNLDFLKDDIHIIGFDGGNLKKSEEALMKMESIKNAKDKSFDNVKSSLEDLQRKLIFVDKTLFKGE